MSLTALVKEMRKQAIEQKQREEKLLSTITTLSSSTTAELAKNLYAADKHTYSFDGYLYQLEKLTKVLAAGVPSKIAIEAIDSRLTKTQ